MEDTDTEKYHPSRVIQDFVFLSRKRGCIRCISLQVYNKIEYNNFTTDTYYFESFLFILCLFAYERYRFVPINL